MENTLSHRTLIFAHRGARREAAENTRTAFDKALRYPIDGIETDVQLSRDGVPVLWHDRFLDKIGLPGKRIDDFDFAQLCRLDFAGYFSLESGAECIMSLEAFLKTYRGRCRLLIEIKNRDWEQPARHHIKMETALGLAGPGSDASVLISSFNLQSLVYAHQDADGCPLVYNFETDQTIDDAKGILERQPFLHGLCLPIETLDDGMVCLLRNRNKSVATYTCNSDDEIRKALDLGVDILISDYPEKALEMRE
ncbi:MAG: glycerophosphodiester phosphodiesterase [Pseudomonadota bacterium]